MGRFDTTKATINANIRNNGNQEITGQVLNGVLTQMVNDTESELTELSGDVSGVTGITIQYIGKAYTDIPLAKPLMPKMVITDIGSATALYLKKQGASSYFSIKEADIPYTLKDEIVAVQSNSAKLGSMRVEGSAYVMEKDIEELKGKVADIDVIKTENDINAILPMQSAIAEPKMGDVAVAENGKIVQYSASAREYDKKYKVVESASAADELTFYHPGYYTRDGILTDTASSGYIQFIPIDLKKAEFENGQAKHFRIALYFNEDGRVTASSNIQQIAFFNSSKSLITAEKFLLNTSSSYFKCYVETISSEQALNEAGDATRIYKYIIELAAFGDGTSLFGKDADGNLTGQLAEAKYIGYSLIYSTSRMHSIALMDDYTQVEGWDVKDSSVNGLVASENNFGKVRMWLSQDAEGNVLNISTEL